MSLSFNQPKFCPNVTWNPNATTFANQTTVGSQPYGIFVNTNNSIYVADEQNSRIQVWTNNSINPTSTIYGTLSSPYFLFVTTNGDIYVDNGNNHRVDKFTGNTNISVSVMNVNGSCCGLFVDINDTLYCSVRDYQQVIKKWLNDNTSTSIIAAGTGVASSASNNLNSPREVFVTINFDLYVADCDNDRIQLFHSGQLNGTTVAGNGSTNFTIALYHPTGIVLDADNYLFIVDNHNHRIVGSGPNGFQCLVGCSQVLGSASNQLNYPNTLSFDSYGNMYVTDTSNNRIQKFALLTNGCDSTTTTTTTTTSISTTSTTTTTTSTTTTTTTTVTQYINQKCFPPTVTLIPGASTLLSPLQFRRDQDFYIVSIITLNCYSSLSTKTEWTIKNCTSSSCAYQIQTVSTIQTTFSELYIPARTLSYGLYELNLTVTMIDYSLLITSSSVYVKITPSGIIANLVQLGTPMIASGHEQDLKLEPGIYSVDPDGYVFNATDWKYEYYCRIYGLYMFPKFQGSLLPIDNSTIDPLNPSCLSNRTDNLTAWKYTNSIKSSVTILSQSLQSNRTYQFMVYMENRRNSLLQATGYVLVQVEDIFSPVIALGCVISTMCVSNMEFQLVNPTTQVALFALCIGNCTNIRNITWNIYQGSLNSSSNVTQWILFNQMTAYQNIWFFGTNTTNFTATNQLFLSNPQVNLWRFEVVYRFVSKTSSSSLNFVINQPPSNGSCFINPHNGTTSSLFTISCPNWFDKDGIKDYSVYTWTTDPSERMMIAFSAVSIFQVRLPVGDDLTYVLHLIVSIRDTLDCVAETNISSISVLPDTAGIASLINDLQTSSSALTTNPIVQLLASGNQNTVGQILSSLSQQFNTMNNENVENAVSSGVAATSISISSLGSIRSQGNSTLMNASALTEFSKELNSQANIRDYLMTFTTNLAITTSNSIKLQASSLAQLTQATNQLTREALITASNKCYQLSIALNSMATTISYEDVQTAANELIQCASNVLTSVNGPLQERTIILDLDSSRANTFPQNYDTDIESEWSNPNLFVDGNDFSYEAIQIGRNKYYQKQTANQITSQVTQIISLLTTALNNHINIGQNLTINTPQVFMSLETLSVESLSSKQIQQVGNAQIRMPSNLNINSNTMLSLQSKMKPLASFGNSTIESHTNLSTLISLSILDQYGNEIPVQTNLSNPIEILIPRDPNLIIPEMILKNVTSMNTTPHNQIFNLNYVNITSTLTVSIHFEIHPLNTTFAYLFIYKFDQSPQLNSSINQIDGWTLLCPSNLTNESIYTYFIDNQQTSGHQSIIFGLRELNSTEIRDYCSNSQLTSPPITNQRFNFTSNYELRLYTSGCYYLDENNQWKSDGLLVGPSTNYAETQCFSTHLSEFTGGFRILPAPINWNYVFANADFQKNKTIYLTVICASIIYLILLIYAHFKDKKDLEKLGVTSLPDNHKSDQYFYQIIVFTGQRKDAETKSKVHFVLSGDEDTTHIRTFADPHRKIFQRGGIDSFIMAVPKSLGLLNYIHIWHDNTGGGSSSSWFFKYLIVRDLQTMEKYHFICQRWLAVEKDDGKIERLLPVASKTEKNQFSYVLSKKAYHSVSDSHLWFSIFSRPSSNKFTCVQRCTCCFVLLFLSMFLNIMYYDLSNESQSTNNTNSLSIGPLHIAPQQILIGVIVELLSIIPSLLLVQFFRRIRCRQQQISPLHRALYKMESHLEIENERKKKSERFLFPWWCLFIAYGLCIILVGMSILFIIARGIEFGDLKTKQWLTSVLTGFFSSILLTQPMKILCLAIFFAFFCRNTTDDEEAKQYLDENEVNFDNHADDYLHQIEKQHSIFTYRPPVRANRLTEDEVASARQERLKEIHMWSIIREISTYFCFFILLCTITYSNQNSNGYFQVNHLQKYFYNSRQINYDYLKISTINDYWLWLEESFVSNIRAQEWYNGDSPRNLSGFTNDKTNRLIGWPIMRQLRVKSNLCSYQKLRLRCLNDYSLSNEEKDSFGLAWTNETTEESSSSIIESFQYKSSEELSTYVYVGDHGIYDGGGYVYEFRGRLADLQSNLSKLHQLEWINNQTRAVIIQFTLYNPNVELFTAVTFLMEFLSTGGLYPSARFEPMSFEAFTSRLQLICMIFYMIFIIYLMWIEMRSLLSLKWSYFQQFWSYIEVGIIVCSWSSVGIYVWRYREYQRISSLFEQTHGYVYINLQLASYVNEILTFFYGFCCFFGTIKFLRLCRFNQRLMLFSSTLKYAGKELISFSMMFSIIFFSFLCLFYLLFISKIWSCSSLYETAQMLFKMTLLNFDTTELIGAGAFLGPFSFSLFIFLIVFVCLSMFLSIINQSFRRARDDMKIKTNEEIFSFMLNRFQRWIGWKKSSEKEITLTRSEQTTLIEEFPEKMDRFLGAINRIYMSQKAELTRVQETNI
ncbi:unnamed protein product [Adineta steineri]|uniref:PLAT domain-containing protein n=1 Tax=Adineta steineri TaxID=433720 RepID=A0A814VPM6_9BILA|nr:unnamed protein product [Adineta steineri]